MTKITVSSKHHNIRIDKFLQELTPFSRSKIVAMIKEGYIQINHKSCKASTILKENDIIDIFSGYQKQSKHQAQDIPLDIIYEDDFLLVVNKPKGQAVHPSKGHTQDTLYNGLLYYFKKKSLGAPGLVHRLDIDTSGLLVIAKNEEVHDFLAKQLLDKSMHREYHALVDGRLEEAITVSEPIGIDPTNPKQFIIHGLEAKEAKTQFTPIKLYKEHTLVYCTLYTGRTHQIRVHAKSIGYPLYEDRIYNHGTKDMLLCATSLSFIHPHSKQLMTFTLELPPYFSAILDTL